MKKLRIALLLGLGAAGLTYAGCKQGPGDRCQVIEDCQDGLVCNIATHQCQGGQGNELDASVPDAPIKMDAGLDAFVPKDSTPTD
jgi:hypothetical protein